MHLKYASRNFPCPDWPHLQRPTRRVNKNESRLNLRESLTGVTEKCPGGEGGEGDEESDAARGEKEVVDVLGRILRPS